MRVHAAVAPQRGRGGLGERGVAGHRGGEREPGEVHDEVEGLRIASQELQRERPALGESDGADDGDALRGDPALDRCGRGLQRFRTLRIHRHLAPGVALRIGVDAPQGHIGEAHREVRHQAREVALVAAQAVQQEHDRCADRAGAHHGALVDVRGDELDRCVLRCVRHVSRLSGSAASQRAGEDPQVARCAGRMDEIRPLGVPAARWYSLRVRMNGRLSGEPPHRS